MTVGSEDPVAVLTRWAAAGAVWRVVARRGDAVTVALCQCDGGEEVGRLTSTDPGLAHYLAGRESNLDRPCPAAPAAWAGAGPADSVGT